MRAVRCRASRGPRSAEWLVASGPCVSAKTVRTYVAAPTRALVPRRAVADRDRGRRARRSRLRRRRACPTRPSRRRGLDATRFATACVAHARVSGALLDDAEPNALADTATPRSPRTTPRSHSRMATKRHMPPNDAPERVDRAPDDCNNSPSSCTHPRPRSCMEALSFRRRRPS